MKNNIFAKEIIIAIILIILLVLFLNPFNLLMPPPFLSMLILFLIIVFGIFAAVIWKEHARDEREHFHHMLAGRYAFLAGSGILVTGIILQSLQHHIDPWLVFALTGMILVKLIGLNYSQRRF
jgi:energy-coupling factor transporter transmembrane protein EcfT